MVYRKPVIEDRPPELTCSEAQLGMIRFLSTTIDFIRKIHKNTVITGHWHATKNKADDARADPSWGKRLEV